MVMGGDDVLHVDEGTLTDGTPGCVRTDLHSALYRERGDLGEESKELVG